MATIMVALESVVAVAVIIIGRNIWGQCFSSEEDVISYVSEMMILIAITNLVDGVLSVLSGIARGCGWQKIGAIVNLASFYFIGIPLGIVLAFVFNLGGKGLWTGIIAAVFAQTLFLSIITLRTDWEAEVMTINELFSVVCGIWIHDLVLCCRQERLLLEYSTRPSQ